MTGAGLRRLGDGLAACTTSPTTTARSRSATSAATSRRSACGGRARATSSAATTADDVGDAAIPLRRARPVRVGAAPVLAARISYAGELGWELTTDAAWAVAVWDGLRAAGAGAGLEPFGYRALDALRMEKGYRYFGTDLTMLDTPFEAGLGAFVRLDRGPFIGRDALRRRREPPSPTARRDACGPSLIGGPGYRPGLRRRGRPPRRRGHRAPAQRRLRSDRRANDRVRLPAGGPARRRPLEVDVFDARVPAIVVADVLVDPRGDRMRG